MPANKYALLRYRIIHRCIANRSKPFPDKEDLRQACEEELYGSGSERISLSTIEKDIFAMRNESNLSYYAPIAYSKAEKGYYYTDPEYSLDNLPLNENDIEAIKLAASTFRQFRGIDLFKSSETAIDKILSRLSLGSAQEDLEQIVQFEMAPVYKGAELLPDLLKAIRQRSTIEFTYSKYTGGKARRYRLHPYLLKEYRNRWYLIGFNPDKSDVATFGLDRINGCVMVTGTFDDVQVAFDPDLYFRHSIGITAIQDAPVPVKLRFTPLTGKYVESQPLHHSQRIVRNDEVALEVELYLCITRELIMQILSYGSDVEVKAPETLREMVKKQLQIAVNQY